MKRLNIPDAITLDDLHSHVLSEFNISDRHTKLSFDKAGTKCLQVGAKKLAKDYNISDGQQLYIQFGRSNTTQETHSLSESSSITQKCPISQLVEDPIDILLHSKTGLIYRDKIPGLCNHGDNGRCLHCSPLEPFDEEYLNTLNPPIKHLSFHAYIKKLSSGASKSKFLVLEEPECQIQECSNHLPWPAGICTKCQPSSLTLNLQKWRHVDNVMFENHQIVDSFLSFWRKSGYQRMGFLYGVYEATESAPLGIRARISYIYEPQQINTKNLIHFISDPKLEDVDALSEKCGLTRVGMIFTDLLPHPKESGKVYNVRKGVKHILTGQECITSASFQNQFRNICKFAPSGYFGSKFVTILVTGNDNDEIDFFAWQLSNQCMSLVRSSILLPTVDVPYEVHVKDSSDQQYVPDVFFKNKDEFGNEEQKIAKPVPLEFFLVQLTAGFPINTNSQALENERLLNQFCLTNRECCGEIQNVSHAASYMQACENFPLGEMLRNIHFLCFLHQNQLLNLQSDDTKLLSEVIKNPEDHSKSDAYRETIQWQSILEFLRIPANSASSPSIGSISMPDSNEFGDGASSGSVTEWSCPICTFRNETSQTPLVNGERFCAMCGIPSAGIV